MKEPCVSRVCHRYMWWLNSTCARCSPLGRKSLAADENNPRALLHTECSRRVLSGPRSPVSPLPPLCSLCEKTPPSRVPDCNPKSRASVRTDGLGACFADERTPRLIPSLFLLHLLNYRSTDCYLPIRRKTHSSIGEIPRRRDFFPESGKILMDWCSSRCLDQQPKRLFPREMRPLVVVAEIAPVRGGMGSNLHY